MESLAIRTTQREELINITSIIISAVQGRQWQKGALLLFCPHTTCGLTINEGADPDVQIDLIRFFREIAPQIHNWAHIEGNSDAHIRSSLLGCSAIVPIEDGTLCLGRWQVIYLYEGDGPRQRNIWLQFLSGYDPN